MIDVQTCPQVLSMCQPDMCLHAIPAGQNAGALTQHPSGQGRQQPQLQAKHAEPADTAVIELLGKSTGKQMSTSTSSQSRRSKQADAQQQDGKRTTTAKKMQRKRSRQTAGHGSSGSPRQSNRRVTLVAAGVQVDKEPSRSRTSASAAAVAAQTASKCPPGASACQRTATQSLQDTAGGNSHEAAAGPGRTALAGVQPVAGSQPALADAAQSAAAGGVLAADGAVGHGSGGSPKSPKEMAAAILVAATSSVDKAVVDAAVTAAAGGSRKGPRKQKQQQQPDVALVTASTITAITPAALASVAGTDDGSMLEFAKLQVKKRLKLLGIPHVVV